MSLTLSGAIRDGAVLQRDRPVPIWGTAAPGDSVSVSICGRDARAAAAPDGTWSVLLEPFAAGGPHELTVRTSSGDCLGVNDILFGEVWFCSGQSNMDWQLNQVSTGSDVRWAAKDATIRYFKTDLNCSSEPTGTVGGRWRPAVGEHAGECLAVAFHFAAKLREELDVPIGLVVLAVGGTFIEAWMPREAVMGSEAGRKRAEFFRERHSRLLPAVDRWIGLLSEWRAELGGVPEAGTVVRCLPELPEPIAEGWNPANQVGACYNGMVHGLTRSVFAGILWYQGENNTDEPLDYEVLLRDLICAWRERFGDDRLAFYYVQIAGWCSEYERENGLTETPREAGGPVLRASQAACGDIVDVGMVTAIDVGDRYNIHPDRKATVGGRLGAMALNRHYGYHRKDEGPRLLAADLDGSEIVCSFENAAGLHTTDGEEPKGFHLRRRDGAWSRAVARVDDDTVRLTIGNDVDSGTTELAYAWIGYQELNLVGEQDLPVFPARLTVSPISVEN